MTYTEWNNTLSDAEVTYWISRRLVEWMDVAENSRRWYRCFRAQAQRSGQLARRIEGNQL
ncbi:MAG: hypothetical protein N2C14_31030 [Planctomycetales bacterium]